MKLIQVAEAKTYAHGVLEEWVNKVKALGNNEALLEQIFDEFYVGIEYEYASIKAEPSSHGLVEIVVWDEGKRNNITQEEAADFARQGWEATGIPYTKIEQGHYYSEGDEDETFEYNVEYYPNK